MAATAERLPQHLSALERANTIRLERSAIKRDVAAGRVAIRDVLKVHELHGVDTLEDVDPAVAGMTIGTLLAIPYRWGAVRAAKTLRELAIAESTRVGALTDSRRRRIVAAVDGRTLETEAERRRREERLEAYRRDAQDRARRMREQAELARAASPPGPLDVECPECRSAPGEACSWFDPVRDYWHEPGRPCAARVKRAAGL